MPSPTIRQIAQEAGVSKSTVSAALRHHPDIAEKTREHVHEVAARLGYKKDERVAELMSYLSNRKKKPSSSPIIWLNDEDTIDAWEQEPWYRGIYYGAKERAEQLGYRLEQLWCQEKGMHPGRIVQILKSRGIRGTLLIRPHGESQLNEINFDFCACAQVLCDPWNQNYHAAVPDSYHNMQIALLKAKELGYKRPALAEQTEIYDDSRGTHRAAYLDAVEQGIFQEEIPILHYKVHDPQLGKITADWIQRYHPDVIICHDHKIISGPETAGLRVPEDIGLIHLNLASDVEDWTGIDPKHREIGAASIDLVINQMQNNETSAQSRPYTINVKGEWVDGNTTII